MRATLLVIAALATGVLLAACGGSSGDSTASGEITIPSDVHGYGTLEAVMTQYPYQGWYTHCVLTRVKKELSPKEAEALEATSGSDGPSKTEEVTKSAGAACEKATGRPVIDPNASEKELALYRATFVEPLGRIAKEKGFESPGVECVERTVEELPPGKVVGLGNGTHRVREGILLSALAQCVKAE